MLRRMKNVPRNPTETPEAHMTRWSKLLHNSRQKHRIIHGDALYFASYFSWCGRVARLTTADPQRKTSRIFTLRNMERLRESSDHSAGRTHDTMVKTAAQLSAETQNHTWGCTVLCKLLLVVRPCGATDNSGSAA